MTKISERTLNSQEREKAEARLSELADDFPEIHRLSPFLFLRTGFLAKFLFLDHLFREILEVPGDILELGAWHGQSSVIFEHLRAIHEPFAANRTIFSFDTFTGYAEDSMLDIEAREINSYSTGAGWVDTLEEIQSIHQTINNSKNNFKNIRGNVLTDLDKFLESEQPLLSLVYFDISTYETTLAAIECCLPHMPRGGIFVLDDYGTQYPGVTRALKESKVFKNLIIKKSQYYPSKVYLKIE